MHCLEQFSHFDRWESHFFKETDCNVNLLTDFFTGGFAMEHNAFSIRHNVQINFITYFGIVKAIIEYKNKYNVSMSYPLYTCHSEFHIKIFNKKSSEFIHQSIMKDFVCMPEKTMNFWARTFGEFDVQTWKKVFSLPYKCTIESKSRMFQFNLLHRNIFTNVILKKLGKVESELCNFCLDSIDSILHRFWLCPIVGAFWREFSLYIFDDFNIDIQLNAMSVIFGYDFNAKDILLEHLLIIAKQYINRNFRTPQRLTIGNYMRVVSTVKEVEQNIAFKNGTLEKHRLKWKC